MKGIGARVLLLWIGLAYVGMGSVLVSHAGQIPCASGAMGHALGEAQDVEALQRLPAFQRRHLVPAKPEVSPLGLQQSVRSPEAEADPYRTGTRFPMPSCSLIHSSLRDRSPPHT
ncbi:MAG: hypothetical protein WB626_07985 [Bacteroidota bacterium]